MLITLLTSYAAISFVFRSLAPLTPFLQEDWSLTATQVGLIQSAAFLGMTAAGIPLGRITDRLGVRLMLLVTPGVMLAAFLVLVWADNYWIALAMMAVAGAGQGAMHGITNKGVLDWFAAGKRGLAVGIKQTAVNAGSAAIALILPPLAVLIGWRRAMLPVLAAVSLLIIVTYALYRDPPDSSGNTPQEHRLNDLLTLKPLWLLSAIAFMTVSVQGAVASYLVLSLKDLKFPVVVAAGMLAMAEVCGIGGRIGWGWLGDKWLLGCREHLIRGIAVLGMAGSLGLAFSTVTTPSWWIITSVAFIGFSALGFHGVWMTLAAEIGSRAAAATATGISLSIGSLGIVFVTPLIGGLIDWTGSFRVGWLACAILMLISFLLVTGQRIDPAAAAPHFLEVKA